MTHLENSPNKLETTLCQLRPGEGGWISAFACDEDLTRRFMEMGLLLEEFVEVLHQAPFGGDPVAIQVRGSLLALRRAEANHIRVRRVPKL